MRVACAGQSASAAANSLVHDDKDVKNKIAWRYMRWKVHVQVLRMMWRFKTLQAIQLQHVRVKRHSRYIVTSNELPVEAAARNLH